MSRFAQILSSLGDGPIAVLAPMAGVTDDGMRAAAQDFGAAYTVSEMVDGRFLLAGDATSRGKARPPGGGCHVVQIAGCRPALVAETVRLAIDGGAEAIDLNMGCPARKVVGGLAGSALMRDLDAAVAIIRAAVAASTVPVTVKMRLGWDDGSRNAPELARRAEAEGVALVTVHGRTRCQFYEGAADWTAIAAVAEAVSIPVLANGDCASVADARAMLARSGAAGVMIGRAAIGRPWLVGDIGYTLAIGRERAPPALAARRDAALAHFAGLLSLLGREKGLRHARKHLAAYAAHTGRGAADAAHREVVTTSSPEQVVRLLTEMFDDAVPARPTERLAA